MDWLQRALLITGIVLLVTGYVRRGRNLMLAAAIALFLAPALPDLAIGFMQGYRAERADHAATSGGAGGSPAAHGAAGTVRGSP